MSDPETETRDILDDLEQTEKLCRSIDLEGNADLMQLAAAEIRRLRAEVAMLLAKG